MTNTGISLVQYRMTDWDWIHIYKTRMGNDPFHEYVNNVYRQLLSIKRGTYFDITKHVQKGNYEIFVKIGCMFITEGHPEYEFSTDYTKIINNG